LELYGMEFSPKKFEKRVPLRFFFKNLEKCLKVYGQVGSFLRDFKKRGFNKRFFKGFPPFLNLFFLGIWGTKPFLGKRGEGGSPNYKF